MSSAVERYPIPRTLEDAETTRLYEAYAERMLAYCTRRLRSRSDAEDAVQTIFLYAMRALRRGVEPECESAWLHTIARNVCNWHQRTAGRRPPVSEFEIESLACAQTDEDVELLSGLREALESLSPMQQHALVLREWHGVPPREIAVELGLTPPQTHALLTRARRALAQALTAPKRAALGLGAVVFEFRAHLRVLTGGASVNAAALVTIAAVGSAGVAGAAAKESGQKERAGREAPSVVTKSAPEDSAVASVLALRPGKQTAAVTVSVGPTTGSERALVPATAPEAAPTAAGASPGSETSSGPAAAPQAGLPVDLPPVDLPPVDLPPVTLPPVSVPPVNLGPVNVPPVNVNLPPVDVPPVEVPPVEVPPLTVPSLPLPPLGLPR